MAFLNNFFTGTAKDEAETLSDEKIKVKIASRPMRKLKIAIDSGEEIKNKTAETAETVEEVQYTTASSSLLKLKDLAEKIRHRVHYIDKNDFAKKAVSNKDKVYDYDLRKDLAYFLANEKLFVSDELEAMGGRAEADLTIFEELIRRAIGDERIGYVVYGEKTYVMERKTQNVEREIQGAKREAQNVQQKAENSKQEAVNERKETQNTKQMENKQLKKQAEDEGVAGLSREDVEIFRKSGVEFLENLKMESQADSIGLITEEERNTLLKIFTKRFLREIIIEKENFLKTKRSFELKRSEELVEFICNSIFKKA
jgi:hypothetical protein